MAEPEGLVLPDTEVHGLASQEVGDTYQIRVGRPQAGGPPASVLFLGDANLLFGTALEMTRLYAGAGLVPPLWVIGIGYPVASLFAHGQRMRDFTPSADASMDVPAETLGGADRFLAFIQRELKPWVAQRYDVDPEDSTFLGGSLGGLFATHVLLGAPGTFRRYGIGSPSYWWDDGLMARRAEQYIRDHDDLDATVFISVGSEEHPEGVRRFVAGLSGEARAKAEQELADGTPDMVADARAMFERLSGAGFPSLRIGFQDLEGEHHATAGPGNLSRALRFLYDAAG
jgi:predicted alpha/beta superfamily hydrolase